MLIYMGELHFDYTSHFKTPCSNVVDCKYMSQVEQWAEILREIRRQLVNSLSP